MKNQNVSAMFNMFSKEQCAIEESVALGRRVGNALYDIFSLNDCFASLTIYAKLEDGVLVWGEPELKLLNKVSINVLLEDWKDILQEQEFYQNLVDEDKGLVLANIKDMGELMNSYFPYYQPQGEKASFRMDKKGFIFSCDDDKEDGGELPRVFGVLKI